MSIERSGRRSILLAGGGELGRELAISARRLGVRVIAADGDPAAPAMRVADIREVVPLADGAALRGVVRSYAPDVVVSVTDDVEIEGLRAVEEDGTPVVPSTRTSELLRDRESFAVVADGELGLRVPRFAFASSEEELHEVCEEVGYPCVVKPAALSGGRGRSVVSGSARVSLAWAFAQEEAPSGDRRLLVEEFIDFRTEVTLLALRAGGAMTRFLEPIAFREEQGERREAWVPSEISESELTRAGEAAEALANRVGDKGLFAADFFLTDDEVILSGLSVGPRETGIVTLLSHDLSSFDLHLRAILGLPVPTVRFHGPSAAAAILAGRNGGAIEPRGIERALQVETAQILVFERGRGLSGRKLGWVLAAGGTAEEARSRALEGASRVSIAYPT